MAKNLVNKADKEKSGKNQSGKGGKKAAGDASDAALKPHEISLLVREALAADPKACMDLCPKVGFSDLEHTLTSLVQYGKIKPEELPGK